MDWSLLRREGLGLIQALNGATPRWTDYNPSDPGITFLESLCYALTDLGYRLEFPIEELLASAPGERERKRFFTAEEVLPCAPVTAEDHRRQLLDRPGVRNAWVVWEKGAWQAYVERAPATGALDGAPSGAGEPPLFPISTLTPRPVAVSGGITLHPEADPLVVAGELSRAVRDALTEPPARRSFAALKEKGVPVERILEGPLCRRGFPTEAPAERPLFAVYQGEIIQRVMDLPFVERVDRIELRRLEEGGDPGPERWLLPIAPGEIPVLAEGCAIALSQHGVPIGEAELLPSPDEPVAGVTPEDLAPPRGKGRDLAGYLSVQEELPPCYGVGSHAPPLSADPKRREAAARLRGYLLLFDQLLADGFAQLDGLKGVLDMHGGGERVWFGGVLEPSALGEFVLAEADEPSPAERRQRSRLLDALLALLGERFLPFSVYRAIRERVFGEEERTMAHYLEAKRSLLAALPELAARRGRAEAIRALLVLRLGGGEPALTLTFDNGREALTVVLPEPPRDEGLKESVETLIRRTVPAHLKVEYRWGAGS